MLTIRKYSMHVQFNKYEVEQAYYYYCTTIIVAYKLLILGIWF